VTTVTYTDVNECNRLCVTAIQETERLLEQQRQIVQEKKEAEAEVKEVLSRMCELIEQASEQEPTTADGVEPATDRHSDTEDEQSDVDAPSSSSTTDLETCGTAQEQQDLRIQQNDQEAATDAPNLEDRMVTWEQQASHILQLDLTTIKTAQKVYKAMQSRLASQSHDSPNINKGQIRLSANIKKLDQATGDLHRVIEEVATKRREEEAETKKMFEEIGTALAQIGKELVVSKVRSLLPKITLMTLPILYVMGTTAAVSFYNQDPYAVMALKQCIAIPVGALMTFACKIPFNSLLKLKSNALRISGSVVLGVGISVYAMASQLFLHSWSDSARTGQNL